MVCLARLIRCAIVASGTRNARAISAVVRPPTARSVSAIADAGDSAGWQHMNSRSSVSSRSVALVAVGGQRDLLVGGHQADDQLLALAAGGLGAHLIGDAARRRPGSARRAGCRACPRAATAPPRR